ncbi:hypothetical protein CC1G_03803 [Coprinopsis cinerea okayama7|uniref:Uncharacterized protein n=1 Tax=Coprinopsis cinerea (strain Okayama-7 / 130 / ATCC MYA-4618 / FGSC 9003) TaxID=240176 RepID=A8NGS4_COPC7|nr:hypothetical protein CC1G_03803 [Coprinopsis cinerea okayama7\|eukprot:XP_001833586.2 hypothetical protein CC1G_03803 [Coprinopsis cinerea okayama7\
MTAILTELVLPRLSEASNARAYGIPASNCRSRTVPMGNRSSDQRLQFIPLIKSKDTRRGNSPRDIACRTMRTRRLVRCKHEAIKISLPLSARGLDGGAKVEAEVRRVAENTGCESLKYPVTMTLRRTYLSSFVQTWASSTYKTSIAIQPLSEAIAIQSKPEVRGQHNTQPANKASQSVESSQSQRQSQTKQLQPRASRLSPGNAQQRPIELKRRPNGKSLSSGVQTSSRVEPGLHYKIDQSGIGWSTGGWLRFDSASHSSRSGLTEARDENDDDCDRDLDWR